MRMVGTAGFEPAVSRPPGERSTRLSHVPFGAAGRGRTGDLALTMGAPCQLGHGSVMQSGQDDRI